MARPHRPVASRNTDEIHDNPSPWVAQAIADNIDVIQKMPAEWMPLLIDVRASHGGRLTVDMDELGCGSYGCVLATRDDDVVMKITTDSTEAEFVDTAMPWGWPKGITEYYGSAQLEGVYKVTARAPQKEAWVLWRQSARRVGELWKTDDDGRLEHLDPEWGSVGDTLTSFEQREQALPFLHYLYKAGRQAHTLLFLSKDPERLWTSAREKYGYAHEAIARTGDLHSRGGRAWWHTTFEGENRGDNPTLLAISLTAYTLMSAKLSTLPVTKEIGEALLFYLEKNVLLADLHSGNYGMIGKDDERRWAITDPGHVVMLPEPWR